MPKASKERIEHHAVAFRGLRPRFAIYPTWRGLRTASSTRLSATRTSDVRVMFIISHLETMINTLRRDYYEINYRNVGEI